MLRKLREFYFTTKPMPLDDVICDGKGWMKQIRGDV